MFLRFVTLVTVFSSLCLQSVSRSAEADFGRVTVGATQHGSYFMYLPKNAAADSIVAVLIHGVFTPPNTPEHNAESQLRELIPFANQRSIVLIAPVFRDSDYCSSSRSTINWGYRALMGRVVGADKFLHDILSEYKKSHSLHDGRFILIGHSAGAQFSNRYLVTHPERVIAAFISAPASYAFPTSDSTWPNGMRR